jgi:outer membrane protein assembly factor BamB
VVWKFGRYTSYAPSPLLQGGKFYMLKTNSGYLSCLDAATGKEHYLNKKLEGIRTVYASIVGVRDRLYVVGKNGTTLVVKQGSEFKVLSSNVLKDEFTASAAIVGNELYLRGHKHLYCIARK